MKKTVLTSFLSLLLLQCGGLGTLSEPRVVGAGFGVGKSAQALKEVQFTTTVKDGKIEGLDVANTDSSKIPVKD